MSALAVPCLSISASDDPAGEVDFPFVAGEATPRIVTGLDPSQSYALYLPSGYDADTPTPILYCYDPRSRGMLCLNLFLEAAERFGYIIASSNNSRSDGPIEPNLEAMKAVWKDTHARLAIDDSRVYATGFSGGARVANIMGQVLGIAGVIGVGGGFPPSSPPRDGMTFDFFGLIGELDFNYYELRRLDLTLDRLGIAHRIDVFAGNHEWAPAELCGTALEWMELRAMRRGLRDVDGEFVARWWTDWKESARELEQSGEWFRAWARYRSLATDFAGLLDVDEARDAAARIEGRKEFKRQRRAVEKWDAWGHAYLDRLGDSLTRLRDANNTLPSAERLTRDLQIPALLKAADRTEDSEQVRAARRVLEMVRVQTAFAQPQHYFAAEDYVRASLCLEIAVAVAPENAVAWYNLACAQAQTGKSKKALRSLARAIDEGFGEREQMVGDPDLAPLRDLPEFRRLVDSLGH